MQSTDGTYVFLYHGRMGPGFGIITVTAGKLKGSDFTNGKYSGTATLQNDGSVDLEISMDVQPNVWLVDGTPAQPFTYRRYIKHKFPPNSFGDGSPQQFTMEGGETITVMIARAPAATTTHT
jgi:hypothetical protein